VSHGDTRTSVSRSLFSPIDTCRVSPGKPFFCSVNLPCILTLKTKLCSVGFQAEPRVFAAEALGGEWRHLRGKSRLSRDLQVLVRAGLHLKKREPAFRRALFGFRDDEKHAGPRDGAGWLQILPPGHNLPQPPLGFAEQQPHGGEDKADETKPRDVLRSTRQGTCSEVLF